MVNGCMVMEVLNGLVKLHLDHYLGENFSVRDDYDFLSGVNKITILPWGWVMEEMNDKVTKENDYIGSEYGIARYQKIKNYDFEAANEYWSSTKDYWHEVRLSWNSKLNNESIVCTEKYIDDQPSYIFLFYRRESFAEDSDISQAKEDIKALLTNSRRKIVVRDKQSSWRSHYYKHQ